MKKKLSVILSFILIFSMMLAMAGCKNQSGVNMPEGKEAEKVYLMPPEGYKLVFVDNFDGTALDTDKWYYRANGERRCGFNSPLQVSLSDGMLRIKQEYRRDGDYGAGWYAGMIATREKYTRGYFEIRCRCNETKKDGFWSAFWIQADHPYDPEISKGGIGGAEIDIVEAFCNKWGAPNMSGNIHCAGSEKNAGNRDNPEDLDSQAAYRKVVYDAYDEFHTYSLLWDEENYTFFIDGKKLSVTDWADGVSSVPEEVIVSLELSGDEPKNKEITSEFTVDYVKIWQPENDIQIKKPVQTTE